jgi:hypothetical protein
MLKRFDLKKPAVRAGAVLLNLVVSAIITAWLTGQPLTGLAKLRGLSQTFISGRVTIPAWVFTLAVAFLLWSAVAILLHLIRRPRKAKIHFIPDGYNTLWSRQTDSQINLRLGGTFTCGGGTEDLTILRAGLAGTDLVVFNGIFIPRDGNYEVPISELSLAPGVPVRAVLDFRPADSTAERKKPLQREVILLDNRNRRFSLGQVQFPYSGV